MGAERRQQQMTRLYEDESRLEDLRESGRDREISLGTGLILGIVLALAVVCAIFFGFGYALGRRSATPVAAVPPPVESQVSTGGPKPTPGSLAVSRSGPQPDQQQDSMDTTSGSAISSQRGSTRVTASLGDRTPGVAASGARDRAASSTKPAPEIPVAASNAAVPVTGTSYVQVAAVSHKEDADLLLGSLRKRGYTVGVRQMPQDKLLHVQIGPMATKKEADAMRQRLQADGYNAIVK